jgi:hypothetical protein
MLRLEADCTCQDHKCTACKQWGVEHRNLHRALELNPWDFPVCGSAGDAVPIPEGQPDGEDVVAGLRSPGALGPA